MAQFGSFAYARQGKGEHPHRLPLCLVAFCVLISLYCGVFVECLHNLAGYQRTGVMAGLFYGSLTLGTLARTLGVAVAVLVALCLLVNRPRAAKWVLGHRYVLAVGALVGLVALQISGSSLGAWSTFFGEPLSDDVLFGIPREIRSDEWCVFTPFSLAQGASGNLATSPLIRGGGTDVTMIYAQPSWSIATLYRPFLWGYLVLGASCGLAFYWCARAIALVLVTYELMLLLGDGRKTLAAYGALLVGFAPIVEWWFAVNGTVELLVFGQGLVLALHHLLRAGSAVRRWGWSALLAWLLGCYALIIYPAWQIPFVYVFGALGIADFCAWRREVRDQAMGMLPIAKQKGVSPLLGTLAPLCACVVLAGAGVAFSVVESWDAIQAALHTVYPGERFCTGGGLADTLSNPITTLVSPLWPELYNGNVCESSSFVSLAPVGLVLAVVLVVRDLTRGRASGTRGVGVVRGAGVTQRVDPVLLALLVPYVLLCMFGFVDFPPLLAKITLLSYVLPERLPLPLGYLDIALLVRSVTLLQRAPQTCHSEGQASDAILHGHFRAGSRWLGHPALRVILSCAVAGAFVLIARICCPELMGIKAALLVGTGLFLLLLPLCLPASFFARLAHGKTTWMLVSSLVVVACGLCVNPVQRGTDVLLQNQNLQAVAHIAKRDPDARWLTDVSQDGQACIAVGAPTLTCVNVYPNLELWHTLDPAHAQEDIYNRYAYIETSLADTTSFELVSNDKFYAFVAPADVPKLGATYWFSRHKLEEWNTSEVQFVPLESVGVFTIYRIQTSQG
ncbi:MAG: hypothetical protein Q4A07_05785 [Coriobacteriales bacterium]|nr:hypothetical protein [Coriobacteriales bacterium]